MKRVLFLVLTSIGLSSCSYNHLIAAGGCSAQSSGPKSVTLTYSAKGFSVEPKVDVNKKGLFIIKLKPSKSMRSTKITIDGVSGTLPGGGSTDPDWMDTEDSYDARKDFVLCVPDVPIGTVYKYSINIPGLAFIDPRVEVTR